MKLTFLFDQTVLEIVTDDDDPANIANPQITLVNDIDADFLTEDLRDELLDQSGMFGHGLEWESITNSDLLHAAIMLSQNSEDWELIGRVPKSLGVSDFGIPKDAVS